MKHIWIIIVVNVKYGKIAFHAGNENVEFEIGKLMKGPSIFDSCCMIDNRVKECCLAFSTHNGLRNPDWGTSSSFSSS